MVGTIPKAARALIQKLDDLRATDPLYQALYEKHYTYELEALRDALEWADTKLPAIGSRWRENDKRAWGEVITVVGYDERSGKVVIERGHGHPYATRTKASPQRFNGKHGGYSEIV